MGSINLNRIKLIVNLKLTDKNFQIVEQEALELLSYEVLADINLTAPVSQYASIPQVPLFYEGIFIMGLYCKALEMQSIEERKRYTKVSDGGLSIEPPDMAKHFLDIQGKACGKYMDYLSKVKADDSSNTASRKLRPGLVTDFPYGGVSRRRDDSGTTYWERIWRNL